MEIEGPRKIPVTAVVREFRRGAEAITAAFGCIEDRTHWLFFDGQWRSEGRFPRSILPKLLLRQVRLLAELIPPFAENILVL